MQANKKIVKDNIRDYISFVYIPDVNQFSVKRCNERSRKFNEIITQAQNGTKVPVTRKGVQISL